jgi:hypothetical protein
MGEGVLGKGYVNKSARQYERIQNEPKVFLGTRYISHFTGFHCTSNKYFKPRTPFYSATSLSLTHTGLTVDTLEK